MPFPTPHIGHSRHGLFFTRLDCQSNTKPSEKDHDFGLAVLKIPDGKKQLHFIGGEQQIEL
jgi:hypothetical protein